MRCGSGRREDAVRRCGRLREDAVRRCGFLPVVYMVCGDTPPFVDVYWRLSIISRI